MWNVELAMRLAFIKEHETRRSPTDQREKSVQIGEICGRYYTPMALRTGG